MLDATGVYERLKQFKIPEQEARYSWLIKAEFLTPDSWAYMAAVGNTPTPKYFVLYTEDFIQSLEYIQKTVEEWSNSKLVTFIEPKQSNSFEDSLGSQYYTKPGKQEIEKWMSHALPDGSDFSFLLEVKPTKANSSYWVQSRQRVTKIEDLPAETQKVIRQHMPPDATKSFLESWRERTKE